MEILSSISDPKTERFECNICLESELSEPVVTLCGHLYCWPCIYRWLRLHGDDLHSNITSCPVCKAEISDTLLVPLYGRGSTEAHGPHVLPRRPMPPKLDLGSVVTCDRLHNYSHFPWESETPGLYEAESDDFGSEMGSYSYFWAAIGVIQNPNISHRTVGDLSPWMRRREMRIERSLHRVSFFIFCCLIMCLLFF